MGAKTKTEKRHLMCRLTEQELEEQGKALTDLLQEKAELEISKSASARHYSYRIKSIDVEIEKQIPIVRDREIERDVEIRIEYHTPEPGKKREVRLDTGEVIFEGQMTDSECQDLFINAETAEEDETIDVPAVKLLPAAEDEQQIIHVEKPEPGTVCQVNLKVGKLYEVEGVVCRCDRETDGQCDGCMLQDKEELCYEYNFACDGVVLKAGVVRPDKKEQNETEAPATSEDKPDAAEMHKCEDCGMVPAAGFVWILNKWLCKACNDKRNKSKRDNLPPDNDLQGLKFRAYHYKGVTNFKFIMHGKASWGNPINLFGDYSDPNTESEALDFYHHLKSKGCIEA